MKSTNPSSQNVPHPAHPAYRTSGRDYANPVDYEHPYDSMARLADLLALRYDANRTRHSYYRQVRLIHEHGARDPATMTEAQVRDYFLFVKLKKHWQPKSIRQARAAARLFFVDLLGHTQWTIFSQIRTPDHDTLPAVLSRTQVHDLLSHVRLRRYRTPLKLIYGCGLRLGECLALTIHDINGHDHKLRIRQGNSDCSREQAAIRIGWCPCPTASTGSCALTGPFTGIPCSSSPTSGVATAIPKRWPRACTAPRAPCRPLPCNGS